MAMPHQQLTMAFVSSAYNEAENLEELHRRCRAAFTELQNQFAHQLQLNFRFVVADNRSTDRSLAVLSGISRHDQDVVALANQSNYGPEASVANALKQASDCDLVVLLCSDLQDPPEMAVTMGRTLLDRPDLDAVLAVKTVSVGGPVLRLARRIYYRILGSFTRLQLVPSGFHGFGCYRRSALDDALQYWRLTDLNLRQCLVNACHSSVLIDYVQAERLRGISSYRGWGYWPEALRAVISGDAAASRMALTIGSVGLLMALLIGGLLLINFLRGSSGYGGGIPTLMGLVLISFALQMLMFAVLSRQIESLRMGGFRPKVRSRLVLNKKDR
jgi:glycosyltransferase involved in cell wall biosynthesis